jgi:tRNA(adenine34) deaminase
MENNLSLIDHQFMALALTEARLALAEDEIPVGAVLVKADQVISVDHNRTCQTRNPLAHAEKLIIDKITASGIRYLQDYTLYVTLEPCLMCAGMQIWSRLGRLVFAAFDPKAGCVGSIYNVLKDRQFNHNPEVLGGVMAEEAGLLLKEFFRSKREI